MTKVKFCGLTRPEDIAAANELKPEYVGFVLTKQSRRYLPADRAAELKAQLAAGIKAVGVFVDEDAETVAALLNRSVIDLAQLHGREGEAYIRRLRMLTDKPLIKAFRFGNTEQPDAVLAAAASCSADYVLLDSGAGTGRTFNWELIREIRRPYFLAGGLDADNVSAAIASLRPYAVDVSSGIEMEHKKDRKKMAAFMAAVRKEVES